MCGRASHGGAGPARNRPRHPERTSFYQLLDEHFEEYKAIYDDSFEPNDCPWRPAVEKAMGPRAQLFARPTAPPAVLIVKRSA